MLVHKSYLHCDRATSLLMTGAQTAKHSLSSVVVGILSVESFVDNLAKLRKAILVFGFIQTPEMIVIL